MEKTARKSKFPLILISAVALLAAAVLCFFMFSAQPVAAEGETVAISAPEPSVSTGIDGTARANGNNSLLTAVGGDAAWAVPAQWTYGEATVSAPHLAYGDDITPDKVTLSLLRDTAAVGESASFDRSRFSYYINDSMPAGNYILTVTVADVTVNDTTYAGGEFTFEFTVNAAEIGFDLTASDNGYAAYEWELDEANKSEMFGRFVGETLKNKLSFVSVTRKGYWATSAADEFYGEHAVKYNLARMHNSAYYTSDRGELLVNISRADTYIVYFNISAPNHADLVRLTDERYDYYFTVVAYTNVATPSVNDSNLTYTGTRVLPQIQESNLYEILWDSANDDYVSGGMHSVSFKLYDGKHYRWLDAENGEDTITVEFEVQKATNSWLRTPNVVSWTFENFDLNVNRIRAVATYLDRGKTVRFKITTDAPGETAVEGLDGFIVDVNGRITDREVASKLNRLVAGTYYLFAEVEETGNYTALKESVTLIVGKASNEWGSSENDVLLPNWIVGEYDPAVNIIKISPAHGVAVIIVKDLAGKEYYNTATGLNILASAPVGQYFVVASVAETDDFVALAERTFLIEVFEKAGMPWWGILLIVLGALLVVAAVLLILWKKGVFRFVTDKFVIAISTKASVDATIASVRAAKKMEESKKAAADAKRKEAAAARRAKAAEERNRPAEERAAALEEKAKRAAERAEKIRARAEAIQAKAERVRQEAQAPINKTQTPEAQTADNGTPVPDEPTITAVDEPVVTNAMPDSTSVIDEPVVTQDRVTQPAAEEPTAAEETPAAAPEQQKPVQKRSKSGGAKKPRAEKIDQPIAEAAATDNSESPAEDRSEK